MGGDGVRKIAKHDKKWVNVFNIKNPQRTIGRKSRTQ